MTKNTTPENRDEVLFAFHQAFVRPTAEQIIEWTTRYPQFADDIRAHAAVSRDWSARDGLPTAKPDETMLARGFSQVLDALYNAEVAANASEDPASVQSFQQIMDIRKKDVRSLARDLGIERGILADLISGRMFAPVGERLRAALQSALSIGNQAFDGALELAISKPQFGLAKAEGVPTIKPRSYESIIRDSTMTPERKKFWLGEE